MKRYYTIDFTVMKEIGLNATKWMVCENIHFVQAITDSGYCEHTRARIAEHHELSLAGLKRIIGELVEDGMLKRNTKSHLKTTAKWHKAQHSKNTTEDNDRGSKNATSRGSNLDDKGSKNATILPIRENLERDREMSPHSDGDMFSKKEDLSVKDIEKKERILIARDVADYLSTNLQASLEKYKQPTEAILDGWTIDIERLIRLDNNTPNEVKRLIDWIHKGKGSFWIENIMSGATLREKFVKLWAQMTKDGHKPVSAKNRILSEVGLGKVFFDYPDKDLDARVHVCLYGEYNALYDFYRNKYVDKDKAVKVWDHIDKHVNSILIKYRSKQS